MGIPYDFQDHGIAHSVHFADPDGHKVEITTYDVGCPSKWQIGKEGLTRRREDAEQRRDGILRPTLPYDHESTTAAVFGD